MRSFLPPLSLILSLSLSLSLALSLSLSLSFCLVNIRITEPMDRERQMNTLEAASSPKLALQRGSAPDALFNNGIVKGNLYRRHIRSSSRPRRHRHGHRRADPERPLNDLSATCQRDDDVGSTSVEEAQARVPLVRSAGHTESAHTYAHKDESSWPIYTPGYDRTPAANSPSGENRISPNFRKPREARSIHDNRGHS